MSVLAIIPARAGSKGIPNKNFRPLVGLSPLSRALHCAMRVMDTDQIVVTTDFPIVPTPAGAGIRILKRPPSLAQDDTPMIDVVKHVLEQIPGPPDQQIVLLQPTQPLRKPEHIIKALELLTPEVDSVVSVVELPFTHKPPFVLFVADGELLRYFGAVADMPATRQSPAPAYIRDGTVYAFWRKAVDEHGNIYGDTVRPLIIPPEDTCPLDTPQDWIEAERRLKEREG